MSIFQRISRCCATLAVIFIVACQGIEDIPGGIPGQPAGFRELIQAYNAGLVVNRVSFDTYDATVVFTDGSQIYIPAAAFRIYDCRQTKPEPVAAIKDIWIVGNRSTGIVRRNDLDRIDCLPVYAYVDETLNLWLNNGEFLSFEHSNAWYSEDQVRDFTVPTLHINHTSDRVHRSYYIDASFKLSDSNKDFSDVETLSGSLAIRGRGQSTWDMPKKPYRLKLNEEARVLGMPANKDWCLLANYSDKSLLRNAVAMRISEIAGMAWTPRHRKVEFYLNNEYQGLYDLFEAKECTKNKVNIKPEDGDLYIEIEQNDYEFTTKRCNVPIKIKEPEEHSDLTLNRLKSFMEEFETALFSDTFASANGYPKYIDVESFVNNYIIEELTKDVDGNVRKSSFLTLERETNKLRFYHVWDFDLTMGNCDYLPWGQDGDGGDPNGPRGWWIRDFNTDSYRGDGWYCRLFKSAAFKEAVRSRWTELYPHLKSIPEFIDNRVTELKGAPARNFQKWTILNYYVWPNYKVTGSYAGEIAWLKEFYTQRLEWMNKEITAGRL